MKKITKIILVSIVFICATFLCANMILNGDSVLKNFDITNVSNDNSEYTIEFEKVPAAVNYKITILDNNNVLIFEKETKKTKEIINLSNLNYGINYSLMVYAYNSIGESRPANEPYLFTYLEPSFKKDSTLILNNDDYYLSLDGNLENKDYKIKILKNGEEVLSEKLKDNLYQINKSLYVDESSKITAQIIYNKKVVDSIDLFNNMNPLSEISITSPRNDEIVNFNDLTLSFDGGNNATNYIIKLYNGRNQLIKTSNTKKKTVVLSKNLFDPSENYTLEIIGVYGDFQINKTVHFSTLDKEQVTAVYMNVNSKSVKKGSLITLGCDTPDSVIYYTINGDNPNEKGIIYTSPIEIKENVILKTVAAKEGMYNSIVKEYNIIVNEKKDLSVFISPSNQLFNIGVQSTGYTNERDEMNDVANFVVERLKQFGVKVIRNNPATNINAWIKDSNYYGVDVHVAIHSNASENHNVYGIETWIDNENSETFGLAHLMQERLVSIYPYKDEVNANRCVKYANGALGEVNNNYLRNGLLIEIAHHDYQRDALWIMQNKKEIGYNIADSILKYYQIIE